MIDLPPPTSAPIPRFFIRQPVSLSSSICLSIFFSQLVCVCFYLFTRQRRVYSSTFVLLFRPRRRFHYYQRGVFFFSFSRRQKRQLADLRSVHPTFCFHFRRRPPVRPPSAPRAAAGRRSFAPFCPPAATLRARLRDIPDIITAFDYPPD